MKTNITKQITTWVVTCFILYGIASCNRIMETDAGLLENAENIIWQMPDSALALLNLIDTSLLDNRQKTIYTLLHIQVVDKTDGTIADKTEVFGLRDYFDRSGDAEHAALAAFYEGRVFQEREDPKRALKAFLVAATYEERITDNRLKGLVRVNAGILNFNEPDYQEALVNLQQAYNFFCRASEPIYQIHALMFMGKSYLLDGDTRSALQAFEKALDICKANQIVQFQPEIVQNMGVTFLSTGDYEKANALFRQARPFFDSEEGWMITALGLAELYAEIGNVDTARHYARQAEQFFEKVKNTHAIVNAYEVLSAIEEKGGKFEQALQYHKQYADSLFRIKDEEYRLEMLRVRQEYNADLLQKKNEILVRNIWIGSLAASMIFISIAFLAYWRFAKQKETLRKTVEVFEQMRKTYNAKDVTIRNLILQHFGIIRKHSLLSLELKDTGTDEKLLKRFNHVIYGTSDMDWDILYQRINKLHDNLMGKMKFVFDQYGLGEEDFKVFCLTYAGFRQQELAIVLNISVSKIQKRMTTIRGTLGATKNDDVIEIIHQIIAKNECQKP